MPQYLLTYHGGSGDMPTDPAEIEEVMGQWGAWYATIGADLVDGGAPTSMHGAIAADGSATDAPAGELSGYTVINAADLAAATAVAQGCPVKALGASVQISECVDLGGDAPY